MVNPISRTAYYCCGARSEDAQRVQPICGDSYAAAFLEGEGNQVFAEFAGFTKQNQSNVARHRLIDDIVRATLKSQPEKPIILIGAGFDSRSFRLQGGFWTEIDEPQIIEEKDARLPAADCPNQLQRIAINFGQGELSHVLESLAVESPLIIVEGVLMYLSKSQTDELLEALINQFPSHQLACDLMTQKFFDKYSRTLHEKIAALGASFEILGDDPATPFLNRDYRILNRQSIVASGAALRHGKIPEFLIKRCLPTLANGYAVHLFEHVSS